MTHNYEIGRGLLKIKISFPDDKLSGQPKEHKPLYESKPGEHLKINDEIYRILGIVGLEQQIKPDKSAKPDKPYVILLQDWLTEQADTDRNIKIRN
jgi:hypothetical protein